MLWVLNKNGVKWQENSTPFIILTDFRERSELFNEHFSEQYSLIETSSQVIASKL